jgi:hypothetical protein
VPLFSLVHGGPEFMMRLVLGVQLLLLAGTAWLLIRTLQRLEAPEVSLVSVLGVTFLALHPSWNGMESALVLFSLAALFAYGRAADVFGGAPSHSALILGLLLGLLFLARLDTVFFGFPVLVVAILSGSGRPALRIRRAMLIGAGTTLMVMPYLLWNLHMTGFLMPISGQLKSTFPDVSFEPSRIARFGSRYLLCLLASGLYLVYAAWRRVGRRAAPRSDGYLEGALAVGAAAMWLHALHSALFMRWAVFRWHHIWYGVVAALVVGWVFGRAREGWPLLKRPAAAAAVALVLGLGGAAEVFRQDFVVRRSPWHRAAYAAGRWASEHTPPSAVFGMYDAGVFGYFSGRSVINLDGVVNDLPYQDSLREGRLVEYLRKSRVGYLVSHEVGKREALNDYERTFVRVRSQLYPAVVDSIEVCRADEVYRSDPYPHEGKHLVSFVIWRLRDPR